MKRKSCMAYICGAHTLRPLLAARVHMHLLHCKLMRIAGHHLQTQLANLSTPLRCRCWPKCTQPATLKQSPAAMDLAQTRHKECPLQRGCNILACSTILSKYYRPEPRCQSLYDGHYVLQESRRQTIPSRAKMLAPHTSQRKSAALPCAPYRRRRAAHVSIATHNT